MHSPLSMQALDHVSDSFGRAPKRMMSSTPATTAFGSASPRPAGPAIGQAVKHAPHFVQASSMSSTRLSSAASKPAFSMAKTEFQLRSRMYGRRVRAALKQG